MRRNLYRYSCLALLCFTMACAQPHKKNDDKSAEQKDNHPPHYNLNHPQVFAMPESLNEISGIAFLNGNADTVYAEQDEDGKLFRIALKSNDVIETKWGKKGDYEDVQLCNGFVVMLRSNGVLFTFSLQQTNDTKEATVKEYNKILPRGEYEGLYADNATNKLYVLCKHCNEKKSVSNSGYIFSVTNTGDVLPAGHFAIDVKAIIAKEHDNRMNFEPSALAKNEATGEWFILSSVNKLLVIADNSWVIKAVYPLRSTLYNQPEGIAFDKDNNLFISNEKGRNENATILKIMYQK